MKYFKVINNNNTESFIKSTNVESLTLVNASEVVEVTEEEYIAHFKVTPLEIDSDGVSIEKIRYSNYII